jgi:hypothetical protein
MSEAILQNGGDRHKLTPWKFLAAIQCLHCWQLISKIALIAIKETFNLKHAG